MFVKKRLFSLLFIFLFLFAHAQQEKEIFPLKAILDEISTKHNIKFNYIDEELIIYQIAPPKTDLSLPEKIAYIESKTGLKIKKISENYYSIYNNQKLDKPLCGYLLDTEMGLPVENATIKVLNNNVSVVSDENGYFELPLVSANGIEISHLNFEKKIITPNELYVSDCPKIKLIPVVK